MIICENERRERERERTGRSLHYRAIVKKRKGAEKETTQAGLSSDGEIPMHGVKHPAVVVVMISLHLLRRWTRGLLVRCRRAVDLTFGTESDDMASGSGGVASVSIDGVNAGRHDVVIVYGRTSAQGLDRVVAWEFGEGAGS